MQRVADVGEIPQLDVKNATASVPADEASIRTVIEPVANDINHTINDLRLDFLTRSLASSDCSLRNFYEGGQMSQWIWPLIELVPCLTLAELH